MQQHRITVQNCQHRTCAAVVVLLYCNVTHVSLYTAALYCIATHHCKAMHRIYTQLRHSGNRQMDRFHHYHKYHKEHLTLLYLQYFVYIYASVLPYSPLKVSNTPTSPRLFT